MKRSEFLKRLGLGIAAIPFAKQVAGAVTEVMNDEAGVMPDPTPKKWGVTETMETFKETGDLVYSHYEEPWIHDYGWPYRMNDIILTVDEKQYLVTQVWKDRVVCTPLIPGPEITLTKDGDEKALIISNLNRTL